VKPKNRIHMVEVLASLSDEDCKAVSAQVWGISLKFMIQSRDRATVFEDADVPEDLVVDQTKSNNPYKSLYGDEWVTKIAASTAMSGYTNVRDIHLCKVGEEMMKGTIHEDDWVFYHNALVLFTAADTMAWMKTEPVDSDIKYYDRWFLPKFGVNKGKPTGNTPTNMPGTAH